jgi:hypothetical protein
VQTEAYPFPDGSESKESVLLNPVRADIVVHLGDYAWSSYRTHAHGQPDTLIRDHPLYLALGDTNGTRQEAYRALFKVQLDSATVNLIRESTNKAWALGGDRFREEIEVVTNHIHLLITPPEPESISRLIQYVGRE